MSSGITAKFVQSAASIVVKTAPDGGFQPSQAGITLKNEVPRRLDNLTDVIPDSANTEAGSTLVYDPATDKYIVKLLDLDGGSF